MRGARGASAHACSTGLSTGRRLMPMTARCGAAAPCRGPVRCCRAVPRRRMVGSCWLCGAHRTRAAAAACETRGNPDRGMSSSAFHTTSQRPAYVALYDPHSQPLEAPVQLSGLPRVFVHALAFSSTPSHSTGFLWKPFFWNKEPLKKKPKKEVDYFWKHQTSNSDYDTVFDSLSQK